MIVIGADTHKGSHALAAVNEGTGRVRGSREIKADDAGHLAAVRWARSLDDDRVWAIEDCRHVSRRLERALLAAGERVVRVPPHRMGASRKGEREPGKSDEIDALAVARAVVKDGVEQFPVAYLDERAMEIRLICDHRGDLVAERTRTVNRLRWHLLELCPELESSLKRGEFTLALVPGPLSQPRRHARGWVRSGWPAFLKRTATQRARRHGICLSGCKPRRRVALARSRPAFVARSCGASLAPSRCSPSRSPGSRPRSAKRSTRIPTVRLPQLPLTAVGQLRRHVARGDRRLSAPLPAPRLDRRRRGASPGRGRVGQTQAREVPLGVQQAAAQRPLHPRALHPPMESVGRRPLRPRLGSRTQSPPRAPHPRSRLEPHHLTLLAEPHPLRPRPTHRPATTHDDHHFAGPTGRNTHTRTAHHRHSSTQDVFHGTTAQRGLLG